MLSTTETISGPPSYRVEGDQRFAPVYIWRVYGTPETAAEIQAEMFDKLERLHDRAQPYANVFDMQESARMSREVREYTVAWVSANFDKIRRDTYASAVIVRSRLLQFLLSAIFSVTSQPARKYKVFHSREAGLRWVAKQLELAGIEFPKQALFEEYRVEDQK